MEAKKLNILVTGAGAPGGPGIIRALCKSKNYNILGTDINPYAAGRFFTKNFFVNSKADDNDFIYKIIQKAKSYDIDLIVPLVTNELPHFAFNLEKFSNIGIGVMVNDYKVLKIINNKLQLYSYLKKAGIDVPEFRELKKNCNVREVAHTLGYPDVPVVFKLANSNGGRGIKIFDPNYDAFNELIYEKPSNYHMAMEYFISCIGNNELPEAMITEYLPGTEVTVDCLCCHGKTSYVLKRERTGIRSGISVEGRFINNKRIDDICKKIIKYFKLNGPVGFQFKQNAAGVYQLLECNPRLQGTSVAALGLGINHPLESVNYFFSETCPRIENIKTSVSFSRFYDEVFFDENDIRKK